MLWHDTDSSRLRALAACAYPGDMAHDVAATALTLAYRGVLRPGLFRFGGDAEQVHHRTVAAVARLAGQSRSAAALRGLSGAVLATAGDSDRDSDVDARESGTSVELCGLTFPHRLGLAAGMDKNGVGVLGWQALGFGHVELGTVTALPQPGNPTPRLFRLPKSRAVINRMGFNNEGVEALATRLREARGTGAVNIPVGVSIGKSKVTPVEEAVGDYLASVQALDGLADYLAVNVSSPNTPGLRGLQDAEPLRDLLAAVVRRCAELSPSSTDATPVLVKLAPDLDEAGIEAAVAVAASTGVAGIIATNTTLSRAGVDATEVRLAAETGGLSGAPLTVRAREVVRQVRSLTDLPLIGVGGVMTAADARALHDLGADLVQLYTGLIYAGPALVREAALELR